MAVDSSQHMHTQLQNMSKIDYYGHTRDFNSGPLWWPHTRVPIREIRL